MPNFPFTSNEEVASWEVNDDMAQFVGFVVKWGGTEKSATGAHVARMLLSNNCGTKVQITAWARLIPKIEEYAVANYVLEIDGAKVIDLPKSSKYNFGNISRELRIITHTNVKKLGVLEISEKKDIPQVVTLGTISKFIGTVQVEATLLNTIRMMKSKNKEYGLGSIMDGGYKLELKVYKAPSNCETKYRPGQRLRLKGVLVKRTIPNSDEVPAPAFFEIEDGSLDSPIQIINAEATITPEKLTQIYNYVK